MATKKRKTKKRRTPAQKAATAKLVALNKKRRGKKKARRNPSTKKKLSTRKRAGTPKTKTRDYVVFNCVGSRLSYLSFAITGLKPRWTPSREKALHWASKAEARRVANNVPKAMGVASNSTTKAQILAYCSGKA